MVEVYGGTKLLTSSGAREQREKEERTGVQQSPSRAHPKCLKFLPRGSASQTLHRLQTALEAKGLTRGSLGDI